MVCSNRDRDCPLEIRCSRIRKNSDSSWLLVGQPEVLRIRLRRSVAHRIVAGQREGLNHSDRSVERDCRSRGQDAILDGMPCIRQSGETIALSSKPLLIAIGLAIVLLTCSCDEQAEGELGQTTTAKCGRFEIAIQEDGYLKALTSATITAKDSGKIEWLAPEGKTVDEGNVLVRMEQKELEEQLDRYRNELKDTESGLEELMENYEKEKEDLEDELSGLELNLELAKLRLDMLQKRPLPAEKAKAEADLKAQEILREDAEDERSRQHELWEAKAISRNELLRADMLVKVAAARYERQKLFYTELCQGATALELEKAKLDLEMAQLNYEIAKERTLTQIARLKENIEREKAHVERHRSYCRRTSMHIENKTLYAPHRGMVIYYQRPRWHSNRNKRKIDVGTSVWTGAAIIELPDLERMKVRSQVSESNIRHVELGEKADVQVDLEQVAGVTYHGKIIWIDKTGRDRNSRLDYTDRKREGLAGINVFDIEIEIDETDERLKLGAKAKVKIPIRAFEDVVYVSKKAVRFEQGRPSVWVMEDDAKRERVVSLGEENDTDVIVAKGLQGGETVVLR